MLIGSKTRFGIDCELKVVVDPHQPIWGDVWIWAAGYRLGEEPSYVDVGLIGGMLCASLLYRGWRKDETLAEKNKEEIWLTIHQALYGATEGKTAAQTLLDSERYHKFVVCGATEGFDNVFGVLVEVGNGERFIWRSYAWTDGGPPHEVEAWSKNVREVVLDPGEYESVVESFLNWLETETGFRPEIRDWVELSEDEREAIRQVLIKRKPSLARPEKRSLLDRAAREELARRRAQRIAGAADAPALGGQGSVL